MEFNIRAGVSGFWIAGGTGESILISADENNRIAEIAADQGRGRVKNIMHVGAPTTAQSAKMAEHAARAGVDAICCVPPFFYKYTDEEVVEHYRVVGAAAGLPLFVYNLPQLTGVEITPELMGKIQERVPQLAGLKHSSPDFTAIPQFAKMGLSCLTGFSVLMLPALTLGASGCVDGPPGAAPELWVEVWNAYQAGDLKRAEAAQDKAGQLLPMLLKFGYFASMKALLSERLGIDCGSPRPPFAPLTPSQRAYVRAEAARLGLTKVAAGEPVPAERP
jgi:dihydrodipicolinate synthase/N-acetylneuraminate lyase